MDLDKALGSFVGLAVGDALGAPLEFTEAREPEDYLINYTTGGAHNVSLGEWTDDTSMAMALARSIIINDGEFHAHEVMGEFLCWYRDGSYSPRGECFDIGLTTSDALERWKKDDKDFPSPYKGTSVYGSEGNGGLMRLAPVVIASATPQRAMELAVAQTLLTHGSSVCMEYSRIFAEELWHGDALKRYDKYKLPLDIERSEVMSGGYVANTYECAMWAFQTTDNFEDCVVTAVNRGHDSDTCGAVAGMIAGSHYGYSKIPTKYTHYLQWHDEIVNTVFDLWRYRR